MQAVDIHSHIGNILYKNGGKLIFKTGLKFPKSTGLQLLDEKNLFRDISFAVLLNKIFPMWATNCERRRNAAATLQNFHESLELDIDVKIEYSVCLPVAPHNTYEDMCAASEADSRIIAFTSPDFSSSHMAEKLAADFKDGAAGVKIHPIIQEVETDSQEVMQAVEVAAAYGTPVLLHSGGATYYTRRENKQQFRENASIIKIERLISAFPAVRFIVGHAGLGEVAAVLEIISKYKNAYVDTSFQSPESIQALISVFGGERVLFASDWPYGLRKPAILAVKEACKGDTGLLKAVLYDNAAEMLKIE